MILALASSSPRRAELVKKLSVPFIVLPPATDEAAVPLASPPCYVQQLAALKADSVVASGDYVILGADTVVVLKGEIMGKPASAAAADDYFKRLCGRTHEVYTGIYLKSPEKAVAAYEVSRVSFKAYDKDIIASYIASGAPFDKAGGYGIQDEALRPLLAAIEGDYDNIVGLPVTKVGRLLEEEFGWKLR